MGEDVINKIPSQSESLATTDLLVSRKILQIVFIFSVGMAALCLVVSVAWLISYQYTILHEAHSIMEAASDTFYPDFVLKSQMQALFIQYTPVSCGILAGVGFGFLGFALFMVNINAKPTLGVEGEYEKAKIKFVNLSPGILVILIAALLIGFCISRYHAFEPKVFDNWNAPDTEDNASDTENNVPDTEKK